MNDLEKLCKLIRYYILVMTTAAGSGHPTSSLSAVELTAAVFFKYFKFDLDHPENPENDRLIFSKGHASPLFYALYAAAGKISEKELLSYRDFLSRLEGHPTPRFNYTEVATGSLGQGLSVGVGEALALKRLASSDQRLDKNADKNDSKGYTLNANPTVYVLLGDGEMAEGSMWEAIEYAGFQKLDNLIAILDVNRLGQSEQTMLGADIDGYGDRVEAFGWNVIKLPDGHDLRALDKCLGFATKYTGKPTMLIAKTIKGKGISFLEDKNGWHGKALNQEECEKAIKELGNIDKNVVGTVQKPVNDDRKLEAKSLTKIQIDHFYSKSEKISTRKAFGQGLVELGKQNKNILVLDGDVQNSTYTKLFAKALPDQFLQVYIAEQNMIGVGTGISKRGFKVYLSTYGSFLTRTFDQLRMGVLSGVSFTIFGSHGGVSVGFDGPSQMGLEDLGMIASLQSSTILYPADGQAMIKLLESSYRLDGIVYLRGTRPDTAIIYDKDEEFPIGGSKIFKAKGSQLKAKNLITIIAAGITLHEALKAQEQLKNKQVAVDVIDCYSIKPIDKTALQSAAKSSSALLTVEDHYAQGGLGDAVLTALSEVKHPPVYKLAVTKTPRSGSPEDLLGYEEIDAAAILKKVMKVSSTF